MSKIDPAIYIKNKHAYVNAKLIYNKVYSLPIADAIDDWCGAKYKQEDFISLPSPNCGRLAIIILSMKGLIDELYLGVLASKQGPLERADLLELSISVYD